ncbi:hypothetical protein [Staphylococcus delphini]|uniref:hypothetical protein n=1 Tax=Staphylococcus delphini TaxID=53344 RepID=UPI0021CE4284|nr:hypothetical protein [Staphylococcus delphini]UXS57011.1 hypothetical protein MUA44_09215 [Staphylococcus delphini]
MTETFSAEEIEVMESNGITRGCALNRIKRLGWSRKQAITKPPIKKRLKIVEDEKKRDFETRVYYRPKRSVSTFFRKS